jgi:TATA-binding protein-associated factor Taf7
MQLVVAEVYKALDYSGPEPYIDFNDIKIKNNRIDIVKLQSSMNTVFDKYRLHKHIETEESKEEKESIDSLINSILIAIKAVYQKKEFYNERLHSFFQINNMAGITVPLSLFITTAEKKVFIHIIIFLLS